MSCFRFQLTVVASYNKVFNETWFSKLGLGAEQDMDSFNVENYVKRGKTIVLTLRPDQEESGIYNYKLLITTVY